MKPLPKQIREYLAQEGISKTVADNVIEMIKKSMVVLNYEHVITKAHLEQSRVDALMKASHDIRQQFAKSVMDHTVITENTDRDGNLHINYELLVFKKAKK